MKNKYATYYSQENAATPIPAISFCCGTQAVQ